jgi:hypothetical protein
MLLENDPALLRQVHQIICMAGFCVGVYSSGQVPRHVELTTIYFVRYGHK